jgi:SHS2 domain-containing protein
MSRFSKPYRLIAHTADLGMEVRGKNLSDLFAQCGWSFFDIIMDTRRIDLRQEKSIVVEAPDQEALLVAWLGELLYIFETEHLVFGRFLVQTITPKTLSAINWGEKFDPKKHRVKTVVKAVTYHQVAVWVEKEIWHARVFFDL